MQPSYSDSPRVRLSSRDFQLLRELVWKRFGLFVPDSRRRRFAALVFDRLNHLRMPEPIDYYHYLLWNEGRDQEITRLAEFLANHETYFLREPAQLVALFTELAPAFARRLREESRSLRVLSLGCSSGEEPYSMAMLERFYRAEHLAPSLEIHGADLCRGVLSVAAKGIYGASSFRKIEGSRAGLHSPSPISVQGLKRKYFDPLPHDHYKLRDSLRRVVRFHAVNILSGPEMYLMGRYDVIFCRNVFIYFEESMLLQALRNIYTSLHAGGYLFLGQSESLLGREQGFEPVPLQNTLAYRKVER